MSAPIRSFTVFLCGKCGSEINTTMAYRDDGKTEIRVTPCEKCLQDAKAQGQIEVTHETLGEQRKVVDMKTWVDEKTGLEWLVNAANFGKMSWEDAKTWCRTLGSGWRLPELQELISIIDYSQKHPALPRDHPFENVFPGFYWSNTVDAYPESTAVWGVDIDHGSVYCTNRHYKRWAWPVRTVNHFRPQRKVVDYDVLIEAPEQLPVAVKKRLKDGWELLGGVAVYYSTTGVLQRPTLQLVQAVVKYDGY